MFWQCCREARSNASCLASRDIALTFRHGSSVVANNIWLCSLNHQMEESAGFARVRRAIDVLVEDPRGGIRIECGACAAGKHSQTKIEQVAYLRHAFALDGWS